MKDALIRYFLIISCGFLIANILSLIVLIELLKH